MGSSSSKENNSNKVTNMQQDQSMELNPMVRDQDLEKGKQQPDPSQKSVMIKRLVTIIITIALLIEPIYSTYVAYLAYDSFGNLSDQMKLEVTDRYGYNMISDINIQTSCNGLYESIFGWMFQGTNLRCDCRGKLGDNITPHFCSSEQTSSGCTQYNLVNEKFLSSVPQGLADNTKSQICIKQNYGGQTFKSIRSWGDTCPTGQRMCGGNSKESKVCIKSDDPCPINSIIVSTSNPDSTIYDNQLQYNSTHMLFFSRTSDKLPINAYKVTSGEGPCYNITQENTYKGRVDPFNFKVQREACDIDPRWQRLSEIGEYSYYQSNDIAPETYFAEIWSFYKMSDEYRYASYVAHYPDWKYENRNLLGTISDFVENRDQIMSFQTALLFLNVANLVINVGFALLLIYIFIKKVSEEEKDAMSKKKDIYNNLIKVCQIAACIYQILDIQKYLDAFKDCSTNKVSDDRTNSIIGAVYTYMDDKVFQADKKMIISNGVGLVVALLGLLYTLYQIKKKQQTPSS